MSHRSPSPHAAIRPANIAHRHVIRVVLSRAQKHSLRPARVDHSLVIMYEASLLAHGAGARRRHVTSHLPSRWRGSGRANDVYLPIQRTSVEIV
jgi:hypothetical protein